MRAWPSGKEVKIERVYYNNNKDKERTKFDQDSGPRGYVNVKIK